MLIDTRSLSDGEVIDTDVVIVGAGLAGITLAREFIGKNFHVCLMESGGIQTDKKTQALYYGENTGHPYYPLDTARARFFGGSSHYWCCSMGEQRTGVRLRAMDAVDFEKRDWVPRSGWPFSKSHLDPFYKRAHEVCHIGKYSYAAADWQDAVSALPLPLDASQVETTVFHFGQRKFFYKDYREEIDKATNIRVYLHANVTEVETKENGNHVTGVQVKTFSGNQCRVRAKFVILALGGIETPRLLLLSNSIQKEGLGNQNDLVGRYFTEHPHLWSGFFVPANHNILNQWELYISRPVEDYAVMGKLAVTEKILRREKILNHCVSLHPALLPVERVNALRESERATTALMSSLRHRTAPQQFGQNIVSMMKDPGGVANVVQRQIKKGMGRPDQRLVFRLNHMSEQMPNPNSRVSLSDTVDALGQPRVHLNWELSELDIRTILKSQQIIDTEMRKAGVGYLHIDMEDESIPPDLHGGWHHMGTTRMHEDPRQGVVDPDCKVHNTSNLFIAGASVFPTVGYANPVLTTVALVLRLAEHITQVIEH